MDYQTLSISVILVLITFSVIFLVISEFRNGPVLRINSLAYFLMAIAYFTQIFQEQTTFGLWFGVIVFNLLVGIAMLLINLGVKQFHQVQRFHLSYALILIVYTILMVVFAFVVPSLVMRIIISLLYVILVMGDLLHFVLTNPTWKKTRLRYVYAGSISLTIVLSLSRMIYAVMVIDFAVVLQPSNVGNILSLLYNLVTFSIWAALILILIHATMQKELTEKNNALETLASYDALTGLLNRNTLEREIDHQIKEQLHSNKTLSLLLIDIDHFKHINDSYGHPTGDLVLKQLATILTAAVQGTGKVYRWGGEEFLILAGLDITQAIELAEGIRHEVMSTKFDVDQQITVSVGVSDYNPEESYRAWFQHVDFALYQAKYSGRNMVKVRGSTSQPVSQYQSIQWNKEWDSGEQLIDEQHHRLVRLANQLLVFNPLGTPQNELEAIVKDIYEELQEHFAYEIQVLLQINFLEATEHQAIHNNLLKEIEQILYKVRAGSYRSIHLFNVIVGKVIVGHILTEDMKFYPYIRKFNKVSS